MSTNLFRKGQGPAVKAIAVWSVLLLLGPAVGQPQSQGCYSAAPGFTFSNNYVWQSSLWCEPYCANASKPIIAITNAGDCYCGDALPPSSDKTADTNCNLVCNGFGQDTCGSDNGDYNMWVISGVSAASSSIASSATSRIASTGLSSSTASATPSIITVGGSTIISTVHGQATPDPTASPSSFTSQSQSSNSGSGTSTAGIAIGVVVGVLGAAALAAGVFFILRKRKGRRHQRTTSVNPFVDAGSPPAFTNPTDSRLDQTMVERRNSNGSVFADHEDYSRRILKVTNPDG